MRVPGDAGVVDHLAAPSGDHGRQERVRELDRAEQVDLEHRVDLVEVLLLEQATGHAAGVIDEQIDLVAPLEPGERLLDRLARGEVHSHGPHLDPSRDGIEAGGVADPGEDEPERLSREPLDDGAADSAVGARDEGGRSVEVHQPRVRTSRSGD